MSKPVGSGRSFSYWKHLRPYLKRAAAKISRRLGKKEAA